MKEINDLIDYSYKNFGMLQIHSEIYNFCKFYKDLNCKNVLEIGSYFGGTFRLLCKLSKDDGKKISIDLPTNSTDQRNQEQLMAHKNMKTFAKDVHVITADSHDPSTLDILKKIIGDEEFDFIFIDGDHTYEGVKKDFEMYVPFLKDGGYVAFHDINDTQFHRDLNCYVGQFWNEIKNENKIEFNNRGKNMGIGVIQVHKYRKNLNVNISFEAPGKIHIHNMDFSNLDVLISVRDRDTKIPIYHTNLPFSTQNNGFFIIPQMNYDFIGDKNFSGFLVEFYDKNKNFIFSKDLKIKDRSTPIPVVTRNYGPFDCLFINFKQMFYDKIYDQCGIEDVKTVIDLGANVGLFSKYISRKKEVRCIHALEPAEKPYKELKNQFYYYNNVHCHKIGVHYFNGKSKINFDQESSILSTFLDNAGGTRTVEEVDVKTLPDFMNSVNLPTVDLIKVDIEGLEYEVFNSMSDKDILRCSNWIVEYHLNDDGKGEILQNRFTHLGYKVQNVPDQVPQFLNQGVAIQGFFFAKK